MASEGSTCEACGATIYKEHIDSGIARYEAGKLMCPHCVNEFERTHDAAAAAAATAAEQESPVGLASGMGGGSKIQAFGGSLLTDTHIWDESQFKRKADPNAEGAIRCRIFHSKLNQGAIEFMVDSINRWIDEDENVRIKHATSTIGIFEGKHADPNIILTLFY